jgi:hypothetical protein
MTQMKRIQIRVIRAIGGLLAEEVFTDVSHDLPELERLLFNKLGPLKRSGTELIKLHQLSVRQNHSYPVVQIMEPLSDLRLIHSPPNLAPGLTDAGSLFPA